MIKQKIATAPIAGPGEEELHLHDIKHAPDKQLAYFRLLLDNTDQAYILFDTRLTILAFNTAATRIENHILNFKLKEGVSLLEFKSTDTLDSFTQTLSSVLKGNVYRFTKEFRSNGNTIWYEFVYRPVFNPENHVIAVSLCANECTGQKLSELKINEQYSQLETKNIELNKINAELDRFVYSASHELRAPLSSLLGLINLASMETDDHRIITDLIFMEQVVSKLDNTIQDIINYSKNAREPIEDEPVDFEQIVNDILDSLRYRDSFARIQITIRIENKVAFLTDRVRVRMILNNIISNAIKFYDPSKKQSFLTINIKGGKRKAEIIIEDNGIGIPGDHLDSIFKMFYKGANKQAGSGLGLYIVKESVEKIQGKIDVRSKQGKGTLFQISIPAAEHRKAQ